MFLLRFVFAFIIAAVTALGVSGTAAADEPTDCLPAQSVCTELPVESSSQRNTVWG